MNVDVNKIKVSLKELDKLLLKGMVEYKYDRQSYSRS